MPVLVHDIGMSFARMAWGSGIRDESRLVIGIPNTGRLHAEAKRLLEGVWSADLEERSLVYEAGPVLVVCARSNDLPRLLDQGMADLIITGYDYVVETGVKADELWDFGFQENLVSLLGPCGARDWRNRPAGLRVATQYPGIARAFFEAHRPDVEIYPINGAAELYARLGAADLIVDAYMTGETAAANGLVRLETIMRTSGRLFAGADKAADPRIAEVVSLLTAGLPRGGGRR